MRRVTSQIPVKCELCDQETDYVDSIPDARIPGRTPSECGYRLQPLCWIHAAERRQVNTSRLQEVLVVDGTVYVDAGRAGGDCICEICHRKYYDHPALEFLPFLTKLCNNELVKL